ncbi:MAG: peptide/nickel transport system permease protein [Gaiellales bacterium]|jgi:peptide/nickel transport system permease protein|nr:peptide/nickel transport system permease protein [Gaiellales bacterium]
MLTFLARRLALAVVTLFLLSVIVFALGQVLPGDVGRNVLGGFASQESVDAFNHERGLDKSPVSQYLTWAGKAVRGDFGKSYTSDESVNAIIARDLPKSAELAAFAFILMIPLAFVGGLTSALKAYRPADRVISVAGLSLTVVPEFVSALLAIVVFGIVLGWLPVSARWPDGAGILTQLRYLLLPALVLVGVLFGYVSRMVRAGTIEALDADYTRTAYLKGLGLRDVLFKHVLRNALLPTIAVVATQTGYLLGGLVIVERAFNYPGLGQEIVNHAVLKDYTVVQAGAMVIGATYLTATVLADIAYTLLNPRIRFGSAE